MCVTLRLALLLVPGYALLGHALARCLTADQVATAAVLATGAALVLAWITLECWSPRRLAAHTARTIDRRRFRTWPPR
jgi:hypothetical protein